MSENTFKIYNSCVDIFPDKMNITILSPLAQFPQTESYLVQ